MVGVQMREQYLINRFERYSGSLRRNLCSFAAINQDGVTLVAHHQRGEPAIHQRQCAARSQQTYIQHGR